MSGIASPLTTLDGYGLPYWLDLPRPRFARLETNLATDAVVIGAGICGLKIAHYLHQQGINCVILEGGQVGGGAAARNQGSINHGAAASSPNLIDDGPTTLGIDVDHNHPCTFTGKEARSRPTDARPSPGNQRNFVFQQHTFLAPVCKEVDG